MNIAHPNKQMVELADDPNMPITVNKVSLHILNEISLQTLFVSFVLLEFDKETEMRNKKQKNSDCETGWLVCDHQ